MGFVTFPISFISSQVTDDFEIATGVFSRGNTVNTDPSKDAPTSYIAVTKNMILKDFEQFEYDFYLTTGDSSEIRNNFDNIRK